MKVKQPEEKQQIVEASAEQKDIFFYDHLEYQEFRQLDDERRHRFLQDYLVH